MLLGVPDHVLEHPLQPARVDQRAAGLGRPAARAPVPRRHVGGQRANVHPPQVGRGRAAVQPCDLEQVLDQAAQVRHALLDGAAHLVVVEQAGGGGQAGQGRAQVVGDVGHEPLLALQPLLQGLGHPVDRVAHGRHLVAPGGADARVQVTAGHTLGRGRCASQTQRHAARQRHAHDRTGQRRRQRRADQLGAQVVQRLLLGLEGGAHEQRRAVRCRPPGPDHGLAVPVAAVGGDVARGNGGAQRRRHGAVVHGQRRVGGERLGQRVQAGRRPHVRHRLGAGAVEQVLRGQLVHGHAHQRRDQRRHQREGQRQPYPQRPHGRTIL